MKTHSSSEKSGFTLFETVIAIGVLAVLLTGFMYVFGPAANGIRKAINVQEADRLASTVERELVTNREKTGTQETTGFEKAYSWIEGSYKPESALFVYQYRGDPSSRRTDGTLSPVKTLTGSPGKDFVVQPMMRRLSDPAFLQDLTGVEGPVFLVKCLQLTYNSSGDEMEAKKSNQGRISDPDGGGGSTSATTYPAAVLSFSAEFYSMPARTPEYFQSPGFKSKFEKSSPVFIRNLAVRR